MGKSEREIVMIRLTQKGTDRTVDLKFSVPKGTTYEEAFAMLKSEDRRIRLVEG